MNDELKEKIEVLKKEHSKAMSNSHSREKSARTSPRVQKANFDSEIAMTR